MPETPEAVPLTPLGGGDACALHFDDDILSLRAGDGRVLMLAREEAAGHSR